MVIPVSDKPTAAVAAGQSTQRRPAASPEPFDSILRHVVDAPQRTGTQTTSAKAISDIRPVQFSVDPKPSRLDVVDQVQRLLDTMEAYRHQLAQGGSCLREVEPLVRRMICESDRLQKMSCTLDDRERLKHIADRSLSVSSMEIVRFNAGHYNE